MRNQINRQTHYKIGHYVHVPQIYVICLTAHNNGIAHGEWIDATQDVYNIQQEIQDMLAESPFAPNAEAWEIHDSENFGDLEVSKDSDLETIQEKAAFFEKHGEIGAALAVYYNEDLDAAERTLTDDYYGEFKSELAFARQLFDEIYDISEDIRIYIDEKLFCRDIFSDSYFSLKIDDKVHVFSRE